MCPGKGIGDHSHGWGSLLMTLLKGPMLNFPWTDANGHQKSTSAKNKQDISIKGALIMLAGFFLLVWFRYSSSKSLSGIDLICNFSLK